MNTDKILMVDLRFMKTQKMDNCRKQKECNTYR